MLRFQSDNGWQTKLIPDSRAIIKLGLGPKQSSGSDLLQTPEQSSAIQSAAQPATFSLH